ncbi:MAG: Abi family protein [Adlercreutzia equolifaciens]|nr:Abi family protein [Adlercreutzia equolifaciens]
MEETEKTYTAWGLDEGEHEAQGLKPMLTPEGQVELLKAKGVTFDRCSEEQAIEALSGRDTFLHTAAYRKLFQVHREGGKAGQYVKLDFADLLDLDALDGRLRRTFLAVTGDIERIAKTRLIARLADDPTEDGYGIVSEFMQGQRATYRNSIARGLKARAGSSGGADTYSGNLIEHYRSAMPVWVFLEVVPFGTLLAFLLFCADRWGDKALENRHYELTGVKAVRNCCAHQSCIINGFTDGNRASHAPRYRIMEWLSGREVGSARARKEKMRNEGMQQLVTTLAVFDTIEGQRSSDTKAALVELSGALKDHCQRYGEQNAFVSFLSFLAKTIDAVRDI